MIRYNIGIHSLIKYKMFRRNILPEEKLNKIYVPKGTPINRIIFYYRPPCRVEYTNVQPNLICIEFKTLN